MGPCTDSDRELIERNRAILAERLHWPDGALSAVRKLESEHAGYVVWWANRAYTDDNAPGFYARRNTARFGKPSLFAATADELSALLAQDENRYPPAWWEA